MPILKNPTPAQLVTIRMARNAFKAAKNLPVDAVINKMIKEKMVNPIGLNIDGGINSKEPS